MALWRREKSEGVGVRVSIAAAEVSSDDEGGVAPMMRRLREEGEE